MSEVPDADVVITNPTHFAALKYDAANMSSPAGRKGADQVAAMIREVAEANHVPIVVIQYCLERCFIQRNWKITYLKVCIAVAKYSLMFQLCKENQCGPRPLGRLKIPTNLYKWQPLKLLLLAVTTLLTKTSEICC